MLGVSLTLLLAGGVALAQGLRVAVDPDCFVCTPRADWPPSEGQFVELTFSGYETTDWLWLRFMMESTLLTEGYWEPGDLLGPPCTVTLAVRCEDLSLQTEDDCPGEVIDVDVEGSFSVSDLPPAVYGDWTWTMWQEDEGKNVVAGPVKATFRFAEVCEVEFVPEPGSILLLGSGLAGLAGYATIRWRGRE
jgi:hypothetical protein